MHLIQTVESKPFGYQFEYTVGFSELRLAFGEVLRVVLAGSRLFRDEDALVIFSLLLLLNLIRQA